MARVDRVADRLARPGALPIAQHVQAVALEDLAPAARSRRSPTAPAATSKWSPQQASSRPSNSHSPTFAASSLERQVGPLAGEQRDGSCHPFPPPRSLRSRAARRPPGIPAAVSSSSPSSVTIASRSSARAIVSSDARPNLFESISPIVRAAFALRDVDHVGQRAPRRRQPGVERHARARAERELEVQPGQEVGRPAAGEQPHVLVELARRDDHEDPLVDELVGDRGRVRDQRQVGRGLAHELPRQRQAGRRRVEEDRRARADLARGVRGDRRLRAAADRRALLPARGRDRGRPARRPAAPARRRARARPARRARAARGRGGR